MALKLTHFPYLWISNQAHEWFVNITHESVAFDDYLMLVV